MNESAGNPNAWMQNQDERENSVAAKSTPIVLQKTNENRQSQSLGLYLLKTVKVDFPRCEGKKDPTIWLCKAEQFFELHNIPTIKRVSLASFHLEEDAHLWYQLLCQEMIPVSWDDFTEGLNSRYGPNQYLDFFAELTRLQQIGSVQD